MGHGRQQHEHGGTRFRQNVGANAGRPLTAEEQVAVVRSMVRGGSATDASLRARLKGLAPEQVESLRAEIVRHGYGAVLEEPKP